MVFHKHNQSIIEKFLSILGLDRAISISLAGKALSLFTLPISLYLISRQLSPEEQGFYYLFSTLVGLSILFELGLGVVITQFSSHEYARLKWSLNGNLEGASASLARLISLVRKSLLWYGVVCILMATLMIWLAPIYIYSTYHSSDISFDMPWFMLVLIFSFNTFLIPITSAIEGCGRIADIQKLRLTQVISGLLIGWIILLSGGGIYSIAGEYFGSTVVMVFWLLRYYSKFLRQIAGSKDNLGVEEISWWRDVFPMQARISVSWVAVYFTNYFIVPLAFTYYGPEDAGRLGMSLRLTTIVFNLSVVWVATKSPLYGALISSSRIAELNNIAVKTTVRSSFIGILVMFIILLGLHILQLFAPQYTSRLLPSDMIAVLCFASVAQVFNASIAGYLRAYRQEPLTPVMILVGVLSVLICLVSVNYFSINVTVYAYSLIFIFLSLPLHLYILKVKIRKWY